MNRGTELVCRKCGHRITLEGPGELQPCANVLPDGQPCGAQFWRTVWPHPFILTENDRKMLAKHHRMIQKRTDGEFR